MTILNARYIMNPNEDPNAHIEIVYADKVLYAGGPDDDGWDEVQSWITSGNTVEAYSETLTSTPIWVEQVRES